MMETQLSPNGCQAQSHFLQTARNYLNTNDNHDNNNNFARYNSNNNPSKSSYQQTRQEELELAGATEPDDENDQHDGDTEALGEDALGPRPVSDPITNGRLAAANHSSHQMSMAERTANANQEDQSVASDPTPSASTKPHHVGPVMGIFFKVWSLVKVTKGRHQQQKLLRRQNSEDAGQFHFIPGHQLAAASGNPSLGPLGAGAMLHDGHFRRAGSQPAPSLAHGSSGDHRQASSSNNPASSNYNHQRRRPQVLASSGSPAATTTRTQQHLPTSNSSSGVSSTTSSTGAADPTNSGAGLTSAASGKRGAPRRPAGSARASKPTRGQQREGSAPPLAPTETKSSWTSRIKRGATGSSLASASLATDDKAAEAGSRADPSARQRQLERFEPPAEPAARQQSQAPFHSATRKGRAQSDSSQAQVRLPRRWMRRARDDSTEMVDAGESDYTNVMASNQAGGLKVDCRLANRDHSDDHSHEYDEFQDQEAQDSDTNDIYSTPNDSIQSVPASSGPTGSAVAGTGEPGPARPWLKQALSNGHRSSMVKSFSATSFAQAVSVSRAQPQLADNGSTQALQRCGPILERAELPPGSMSRPSQPTQPDASLDNSDASQARLQAVATGGCSAKRLSNGSRFFISSSSSEDSNPSQQHQLQLRQHQQQSQPDPSSAAPSHHLQQQPLALEKHNAKLPVHFGLHYHDPHHQPNDLMLVTRPDTLIIGPTTTASSLTHSTAATVAAPGASTFVNLAAPLATPIGDAFAGPDPSTVAAMSPAGLGPAASGRFQLAPASGYKKSPSLFEMSNGTNLTKFSSRFPFQHQHNPQMQQQPMYNRSLAVTSFQPPTSNNKIYANQARPTPRHNQYQLAVQAQVPNSISLQDCKLYTNLDGQHAAPKHQADANDTHHFDTEKHYSISNVNQLADDRSIRASEYRLTQMLLESGSNPSAKDQNGCTALMHAVLSENIPALKCLIEFGVDLNDTNHADLSALDLVTAKAPTETRMEMLKLLIDSRADLDRARQSDGTRLLDRLIAEHQGSNAADKMPFIDCLLHNGAKLGSSTWLAADGKHEIQLRLLRKLCQDGYFLYKKSSIEAAVYRFEYALRRIAELEQQLSSSCCRPMFNQLDDQSTAKFAQQIKYQTYLGLSRCERKRGFYKRALEFAHMSILVDSTSYEGYYSKAHILKDLGEMEESKLAIDQTGRLVDKSIELIKSELNNLQHQEESIVFDGCFNMHDPSRSCRIEANRNELISNLEYLEEAKKHIARLRGDILENKLSVTEP